MSPPSVEPAAREYIRPPVRTVLHNDFRGMKLDAALHLAESTLLLDYSVTTPPTTTIDSADAIATVKAGERRKQQHYGARIPPGNWGDVRIKPLVFSAFGLASPLGIETINSMAESLSAGSHVQKSIVLRRLQDTISVALWRGNSGIIRAYRALLANPARR